MKMNLFKQGGKMFLVPLLALTMALAGCSGDDGAPGPAGPPGSSAVDASTAPDSYLAELNIQSEITGVTIASPPVVNFKVQTADGVAITGIGALKEADSSYVRFTITKLVPGTVTDPVDRWMSYILDSGGEPTYDRGSLVDHGDGTYTFTFNTDVKTVAGVTYDPTLTHRVAGQIGSSSVSLEPQNLIYDFVPSGAAVTKERNVAVMASCNECHDNLVFHGRRFMVEYCVNCHTSQLVEGEGDLPFMIHRIHSSGTFSAFVDRNGVPLDFSNVVYPQDLRHCSKCHTADDAATPQGDNWKNAPSKEACGGCHTGPHPADQVDNSGCKGCHGPANIEAYHEVFAEAAAALFDFQILNATPTTPGGTPAITFAVVNPETGLRYNLLTDPAFTGTVSPARSTLNVMLAWDNSDYSNNGTLGGDPGYPVRIRAINNGVPFAGMVDNLDNSYTVTSPVAIPATLTGSLTVAMDGHPIAQNPATAAYEQIPATSVVKAFKVTDTTAKARRTVVDTAKCNQCHAKLSLHGGNRSNNVQECVVCHNARGGWLEADPAVANFDGTAFVWDFKYLIHKIHTVGFPGNLNNCTMCHTGTTYRVPQPGALLGTTIDEGADVDNQADDLILPPASTVCFSCHNSDLAKLHIMQNGGEPVVNTTGDPADPATVINTKTFAESCAVCHAAGKTADVAVVHGL